MADNKSYLSRMKIENFGVFSNMVVGPFSPTLNVAFGKNEAGKTTFNAFVNGVIFGWEEARGKKNTYKPKNSERSGSLFFTCLDSGEEIEFSRSKNSEGLIGPVELLNDIDKDTFQTMFALTSDELRSLRNTTDVTAKLLTAGSGTSASPTEALNVLQAKIAEYTSKAAGATHSLVNIASEKEELRFAIARAGDEAAQFKQQDKEFRDMGPQRKELTDKLQALNKEIEELTACRATLEKTEHQIQQSLKQKETLLGEEKQLVTEHHINQKENSEKVTLSPSQESHLRDQLDKFSEALGRSEQRVSHAKDDACTSKSFYEALLESENFQEREEKARTQRRIQMVLSILFPCLFMVVGVPFVIHGWAINSLSLAALGVGLIIFALVLATAALALIFRPNKSEEEFEDRKKDAQWVMLQDKKKLESNEEELKQLEATIREHLDTAGLAEAQGSLRRARSLLDEAKESRSHELLFIQQQQALVSQLSSVEDMLVQAISQKKELLEKFSLPLDIDIDNIQVLIDQRSQQRKSLSEVSENINRRYGGLKQELSQAKNLRELDKYKLLYQEACTRHEESTRDYARLLLAKHMLEAAINAWESKSQPEVYKQASRLLEKMTAGKWVHVRMSENGRLQVIDAVKTVREPLHLSLGACQQLYLSLRIALLMTAENVGKILPIMADDILVNFDEERREGAAWALRELSLKRQVILFTCHKEVVSLMCEVDSHVNLVEL